MAIKILKEVNRMPGYLPKSGESILPGNVLMLDGDTVKKFDGTADRYPLGFALDSNVRFSSADSEGRTAGYGYDYTNYARGGLIGVILGAGSVIELFDDTRGHPVVTADIFNQNAKVYSDNAGKITASDGGGANPEIGSVISVSGSGSNMILTIKTSI